MYKSDGVESTFYCPFCKHRKPKLNINLVNQKWHCWVCDVKGRSLWHLFKKVGAQPEDKKLLVDIAGKPKDFNLKKSEITSLPEDFCRLYDIKKTPHYKNAIYYLKTRGLTMYDIMRYNIGYCEKGLYSGMIVIPSYDKDNQLNFFTARSFYDVKFKHRNPQVSKDIVGFENQINWSIPIVLVEGAFDAISAKINAIPLFGKLISDALKLKVLENSVKKIYIALDKDALKDAFRTAEYFMNNGVETYIIEIDEKDPSELGSDEFRKLLRAAKPLTFSKIIEYKLL
jgi:DNA primase